MTRPTLYEYCKECPVCIKYPELCFGLLDEETRKLALGDSCPIEEENRRVVEDIFCPTGLVRRLMKGESVRGEFL